MVKRRSDHSLFKKAGNSVKKSKYFQSKKRASYGSQVESKKPASTDGKDDECSCSHSDCPGLQEECQEKFLVYGCRSGCSSVDSCISSAVSNVEQERVPTLEGMTPSSGCHVDQFIKKECLVTPDTYTDMPRVQEASTSTTTDTAPLASGGLLSSSRIITADDAVQALDTVNQLLNLRECHVQDLKRERNELSIKVSSLTAETEELRRKLSEQNNLIINLKKELQMNDERRNSESAALQGEIIQLKHKISMMEESRHAFNERIDVLLNGMSTEMNTSEEISSFDSGKSSHSVKNLLSVLFCHF
ncbi:hypothetical protein AB6A40_004711 [Gnathostoma spinigerum]|uniref:Uncharacterized protein n=1 Tax=Gnathostoma spinigerum TaxID=75299 RepID=A0ABD6EMS1_9BILA